MLPPHELKNKTFTKAMRGYNPVEVDEYIDFLTAKYTELYRENDELERKLKAAVTRLDELKSDEDSIRSTLIDAKRAANKIKADAEDRAENIVRSAKASCNTILSDFNEKIEAGRYILAELQRDAFELKNELFVRYSEHIKFIEKLTEGMDETAIPETGELHRRAVEAIKADIAGMYANADEDTDTELPETEKYEPTEPVADSTREFDISETAESEEELVVDRQPLVPAQKQGLRDSVKELNRIYKNAGEEIVNTPDSDVGDDASYLDFVKSVTGKQSTKDADFDMLFDDGKKKKKK